MSTNYTPLNLNSLPVNTINKTDDSKTTAILIIIATITAAILAALLFYLIQKKLQQPPSDISPQSQIVLPTINAPSRPPTPFISPIITTSEAELEDNVTPIATLSPTIRIKK